VVRVRVRVRAGARVRARAGARVRARAGARAGVGVRARARARVRARVRARARVRVSRLAWVVDARRVALEALEQPPIDKVLGYVRHQLVVEGVDVSAESGGAEEAVHGVGEVEEAPLMDVEGRQVAHVDQRLPPAAWRVEGSARSAHAPGPRRTLAHQVELRPVSSAREVLGQQRSADLVVREQLDLSARVVLVLVR
jgi:hypothetical protein